MLLTIQHAVFQAGHGFGKRPYRQVEAAVQHALLEPVGRIDLDMELYLGRGLAETADGGELGRASVGEGGFDQPQPKHAVELLADGAGFHLEDVDGGKEPLRGCVHLHAFLGQAKAAAATLAQAHA